MNFSQRHPFASEKNGGCLAPIRRFATIAKLAEHRALKKRHMTEAARGRPPWKPSTLRRWRDALRFLKEFEPQQIRDLIRDLQNKQTAIESGQREIRQALRTISDDLAASKQINPLDGRNQYINILNVKNLGYEIGRILAERELQNSPTSPGSIQVKSKLCVQDDFKTDWLLYWCKELKTAPAYHRKIWEFCYICQVLFTERKLSPGRRGLGFGCGQEPLPSLFAKHGVQVTATDLDPARVEAEVWRLSRQHAGAAESLRRRDICPDEQRLAGIEFRPVDMSAIPAEFDGQFDFCWSACALEHLGSLAKGLAFVENSLRTLRPGGVAVHTTEYTLDDGETIDNYPTVLYQSQHLVEFAERMHNLGYQVEQYDFDTGNGILDRFVDLPPWAHKLYKLPQHHAHLRLNIDGFVCTSVGIIIRKPVHFQPVLK